MSIHGVIITLCILIPDNPVTSQGCYWSFFFSCGWGQDGSLGGKGVGGLWEVVLEIASHTVVLWVHRAFLLKLLAASVQDY